MAKKKICAYSIADSNNLGYFKKLKNSLKHFHPDLELVLFGPDDIARVLKQDSMFLYRSTPALARELIKEYETIIKLDADQVITGDISHIWEGDFDVAVVNNSNPREHKTYPITVWNVHPLSYVNCGTVIMKSEAFVDHWWKLCTSPHFDFYQMKEQDLLNIMIFYGNYKVNFLDNSKKMHGLISRQYEPMMILKEGKLILPANKEWNIDDREVVIWHAAGGGVPHDKMNFKIMFKKEVVKYLEKICS